MGCPRRRVSKRRRRTPAAGTARAGPAWLWDGSPIPDPLGRAEKAVRFIRKLRLHEGRFAGQPFPLADWQERLIRRIYGPVDELGRRQVRTAFVMVPRGSGKSSAAAAIGLLHCFGPEKEAGGQVIAAAADREQAGIVFGAAEPDDRAGPGAEPDHQHHADHQADRAPGERLDVQGGLARGLFRSTGCRISCLLADEVHAWPTRELWDVLTT